MITQVAGAVPRLTAIIAFAITPLAIAAASEVSITGAKLSEYGIYEYKRTGKLINAPETATGIIAPSATSARFLKQTDVIEAHLKTRFGITFTLVGTPKNAVTEILVQRVHPKIRNPDTGKVFAVSKYKWLARIGKPCTITFSFDKPWEMVSGRCTYQIFVGSKLVLEKSFEVQSSN